MRLDIHRYGDPVLRQPAEPIAQVDDEIRTLAADMVETMHAAAGVGLAAQQVGKAIALCVVEVPDQYDVDEEGQRLNPDAEMPLVLVNPTITQRSKTTEKSEEGCLSFPEISALIPRALEATVTFTDLDNRPREMHLRGFVARVAQHEVDHLNGVLFIDHMSQVKRLALSGQLKRMRKETLRTMEAE